jgi:type IV pilus assembly protein PilB
VLAAVEEIIGTGLAIGASDIHVEVERRGVIVRYRVDGSLQPRSQPLPPELSRAIASRLKLLARLDITETRKPQDGRITVRTGQRMVDLRVSSMPAKLGEKVVMRILDAEASVSDLKRIFAVDKVRQLFSQLVFRPQGLVMVTGPTGSGKTTTLYSGLAARRKPELNVVTVEDPIEYHLDGVTQIQVAPEAGTTFATILRSLLRQDPDVIMVGETRDRETARTVAEAANTGHLVLTSAHTNGALDAVARLADLGVEPYAIASSLIGVLSQRLVRRVCADCAEPFEYPDYVLELMVKTGAILPNEQPSLVRGRGCAACRNSGFRGRVAVCELLVISDPVRDAIGRGADLAGLRAAAQGALVEYPRYAGILVGSGVTVPGEILHMLQKPGVSA